jgi:hypothetical protein
MKLNNNQSNNIQGLEYFFSLIEMLDTDKKIRTKLRYHPSEGASKYKNVIKIFSHLCSIETSFDNQLVDDLSWSQCVY